MAYWWFILKGQSVLVHIFLPFCNFNSTLRGLENVTQIGKLREWRLCLSDDIFYFAKPRLQLQLSTTSQMCHFTCCSYGKMRKLANSVNGKLLIFIPLSKKHSYLSEFNISRALKSEQKEAIFTLVLEKMRNDSRRCLFGLVTQHALSLTGNRGRCETRLKNSCDNSGRGTDTFYFCLGVFSQ